MFQIGDVIVSDSVLTEYFFCDLSVCHGQCCVDGDAGAPVDMDEALLLEDVLPSVWNDLSSQAKKVIDEQGVVYPDCEGQLVTSIVNGKDCAFTCHGEDGVCYCAIEKAFRNGKISFRKPKSCSLYPIRVSKLGGLDALNFHEWDICQPARILGRQKNIRVYEFLKRPLVESYGENWYNELLSAVEELKRRGYIK